MSDAAPRRVTTRLDLPEADFVALKVLAVERDEPMRDLLADAVAAWLDAGAPPADLPPAAEPIARTNILLPEPVHRRLKLRAAVERATMQALIRAALAPLLAAGAPPPCRVVAVVNPRPRAGRTAIALAVGRALAEAGQRVLLVDLDPAAGLTRAAGLDPAGLAATVADLLAPGEDGPPRLAAVLRPLGERLALLPAGPALARAELALLLAGGQERALAEALRPALADFDVALLDCPPSLGLLTLAALVAADEALVPADPDGQDALELDPLLAALDRLRAGRRAPRLTTIGIVATPGSGKAKALVTLLDHLSRPDGPPELLGELPLANAAARARGAAAIAARLRPAPAGGAPSPA